MTSGNACGRNSLHQPFTVGCATLRQQEILERQRRAGQTLVAAMRGLRPRGMKKGSPTLSEKIEQLLSVIDVLPLEVDADREYGVIRSSLEKIGANDMLIAAHALSQNLTLITDNTSEFSRIDCLKLENWLKP